MDDESDPYPVDDGLKGNRKKLKKIPCDKSSRGFETQCRLLSYLYFCMCSPLPPDSNVRPYFFFLTFFSYSIVHLKLVSRRPFLMKFSSCVRGACIFYRCVVKMVYIETATAAAPFHCFLPPTSKEEKNETDNLSGKHPGEKKRDRIFQILRRYTNCYATRR